MTFGLFDSEYGPLLPYKIAEKASRRFLVLWWNEYSETLIQFSNLLWLYQYNLG